jgi:hypothetical protein
VDWGQKASALIGFTKTTETLRKKPDIRGRLGSKGPCIPYKKIQKAPFLNFVWEIEKLTATNDPLPLWPIRSCLTLKKLLFLNIQKFLFGVRGIDFQLYQMKRLVNSTNLFYFIRRYISDTMCLSSGRKFVTS